ncbi:MAG: FecR family protein [Nitrospirales bacterium]
MDHLTPQSNEGDKSNDLRQEAIDWHIRLTSDEIISDEIQQFEGWHSQSQAHKQAWKEVKALWGSLEPLRQETLRGETPLKRERHKATPLTPTSRHSSKPTSTSRWVTLVATIGLIGAATLVSVNFKQWFADYSTAVGERRIIALQDGSKVELNSETAISVKYSLQQREIELLTGEALFVVEPDAQRPFVVQSDEGLVKAIGTSFIVKQERSNTRVAVLEGIVEVQAPSSNQRSTLTKEMVASYNQTQGIQKIPSPNMEVITAWRKGYLIFDHTPLREAIAEINQHKSGEIVLVNRDLDNYRISGMFRLDALEDAVAAIEETTPAESLSITPYLVLLH